MKFFGLGRWWSGGGFAVRNALEHLPNVEREGDVLGHCVKCGTRMFKTADGEWKATSIHADTCQDHPEQP